MQRRRQPAKPVEDYFPKSKLNSTRPHWRDAVEDAMRRVAPILPKRVRQMNRLRELIAIEGRGGRGLAMHCMGGIAYGKDERELVDMGLCALLRTSPNKSFFRISTAGERRSILAITDKGRAAVEEGKIKC